MSSGFVPNERIFMASVTRNPQVEGMKAILENIRMNYASAMGKQIYDRVEAFFEKLDETQDVGMQIAHVDQAFHLDGIYYANPSLIHFIGKTGTGEPIEVIQHTSQIHIVLTALPRRRDSRPIGFGRMPEAEEAPVEEEETAKEQDE